MLVLVLVFIVLFGVVVGVVLSQLQGGLVLNTTASGQSQLVYAANSGTEWAVTQLATNHGLCGGTTSGSSIDGVDLTSGQVSFPAGVTSVKVNCQQVTGSGSNTFGGFALVAGLNSHGKVANNGSTSCQSLSTDPIGSSKPTYATYTGSSLCASYPSGTVSPIWSADSTPDSATSLAGGYTADQQDTWVSGTNGGKAKAWYSDGEEWTDVTGNMTGSAAVDSFASNVSAGNDTGSTWVAGNNGNQGVVWSSTNAFDVNAPNVSWTRTNVGPNGGTLTDMTGIPGTTSMWVAGNTSGGGAYGYVDYSADGVTWAAISKPPNATAISGIFATDTGNVWVAGTSSKSGGIGAVWYSSNSTGATPTWTESDVAGTKTLTYIDGADTTDIWVVGTTSTSAKVSSFSANGSTWSATDTLPSATSVTGVFAADATDVWASGTTSSGGAIWFCNGGGTCSWTQSGQSVPSGTATLNDLVGFGSQAGEIYAVGASGTVLTYAPISQISCAAGSTPPCLADILGGDVFNGNGINLATGLDVTNGNFEQSYSSSQSNCASLEPQNMLLAGGYSYQCPTSVPAALQLGQPGAVDLPLPSTSSGSPAACVAAGNCTDMSAVPKTVTVNSGGCSSYTEYAPGYYKSKPTITNGQTTYFESGIYYFPGGGFGGIGHDGSDTWLIGGLPSPGDTNGTSAQANPPASSSPCWSAIQANGDTYNPSGSWFDGGTGIEWILGGNTWLDVHTIHWEMFTRLGPAGSTGTWEGGQGITIREVPPQCSAGDLSAGYDTTVCVPASSGWVPTVAQNNQLFQVDANGHQPNVWIHGGIFAPDANIEEFTNTNYQVTLGPIWANSVEFTYASSQVAPLQVSAGSPNLSPQTIVWVKASGANSAPITVQAVFTTQLSSNGTVAYVRQQTWRICPSGSSAENCPAS
jgi:hypothetical protein